MRMLGSVLIALTGCASQAERESRAMQSAPWLGAATNESYIVVTVRSVAVAAAHAGSTARDYGSAQTYGPSPRARSEANKLAAHMTCDWSTPGRSRCLNVHCVVYAAPVATDKDALIARLRADRMVESAQALNAFDTLVTDDKGPAAKSLAKQYSDPYFELQSNLQVMQVPQAQRVSRGAGIRVAIVDTGVDARHPDLKGRVSVERDFVGGTSGTAPERHGTAVAGVIAALDNNQQGIVGIAPAAQLLSLRACWPAGAK